MKMLKESFTISVFVTDGVNKLTVRYLDIN